MKPVRTGILSARILGRNEATPILKPSLAIETARALLSIESNLNDERESNLNDEREDN